MGRNGHQPSGTGRDEGRIADCAARAALLEGGGFRWSPASRCWLHPGGRAISVETLARHTPEAIRRWIETGVIDET